MTPYPLDFSRDVELIRDLPYGFAGGRELLLDLARPKTWKNTAPLPAFVYMHGGAWISGSKEDGVPAICYYASHGFAAASVGYRLSGEARFPAQLEDCKCAVRFLRAEAKQLGLDAARIGTMGSSAGGHLAILLGLTGENDPFENRGGHEKESSRVSSVCDLFGVSDFLQMPKKHRPDALSATAQFLGGTVDQVPEQYRLASPVNYVHAGAPPFLIVHGDQDKLVPPHQSELLHEALRKAGVESTLKIVQGAEHGSRNVINPDVRATLLAFLKKHLQG